MAPTESTASFPRPTAAAAAWGLLAAAVALRVLGVWQYRFNSDEPQHAHVVWGWTRGLVQYRDLFDNHTPLFHLAWAPLLAAFGESVRTLFWLRLTMLPLYLACLAVTAVIGRRLLGSRAARWGTVLTALLPPFFVKTLEFRTDVPWTLLWLAVFQLLTGGPLGPARLFAAGLLAGAAAAVSLKSSLLLVCLLGAALAAWGWPAAGLFRGALARGLRDGGARTPVAGPVPQRLLPAGRLAGVWRALAAALAVLAGTAVMPAAVALYFEQRGALAALYRGAVLHNLQVAQHGPGLLRRALIVTGGGLLLLAWGDLAQRLGPPALARQRLFLLLTTGSYWIALQVFWPLVTSQTYLPVEPLFCLFVAALATAPGRPPEPAHGVPGGTAGGLRWAPGRRAFLVLALAVELAIDLLHGPLRGDQTAPQTAIVAEALRLTAPGEAVFDDKGDLVFRRRAFYPVLEDVTRDAMASGRIADTIPEAILASHACVAIPASRRLPPRGRAFLAANFLPVGHLRVCGKWLPAPAIAGALPPPAAPLPSAPSEVGFEVAISERYAIVDRDGPAAGRLDGAELSGPRQLATGPHRFAPRTPPPWALVWARAIERGFSPFSAAAQEQARNEAHLPDAARRR
jgi:hypothetical protein